MKKTYFNEKVNDKELLITESYVRYDSEVIPINAISYFGIDNTSWKVILIVALCPLSFGLGMLFSNMLFESPSNSSFFDIIFIPCISTGIILLLFALIFRLYRSIIISTHSKHRIQIYIFGNKYKKTFEPLMKALYEVVEDNNPLNSQSVS